MTSRRPRRHRRERGSTLPRPTGGAGAESSQSVTTAAQAVHKRERHTKTDYSYVKNDLVAVAAVGAATLVFVGVMAAIL